MLFAAALATAACGIGNTVSTSLPPVDAMDDEAITPMNTPVDIFVLTNDLQDDDLVTDVDDPVDQNMNVQVGAVEIDILSFPEKLIYTPPAGFVGTVTFDYEQMQCPE